VRRVDTRALLVRSVEYGEADLVATFFTESDGKMSAIVRGARRSSKRFAGALEPIHELFVILEDKGKELCTLKEARIARARIGIASDLEKMEAAGRALRWVRHLCPPRTPEPSAWESLGIFLETLERGPLERERSERNLSGELEGAALANLGEHERGNVSQSLAVFGFRVLAAVGYGIDFERCARCGRPCPEGRAAYVDAGAGGLICTTCGGARRTLSGELRTIAMRALAGDPGAIMTPANANELLEIIDDAMAAHTDFDAQSRR
jgi:DNA repair protein RecO (recombination protein O)